MAAGRSPRRPCGSCGATLRASDRFCRSCGAPTTPAPARAGSPSLQVATEAPTSLAEQRKVVTVMFADLSGSTALGEKLDPEELRAVYARFFASLSSQLRRYGGTIDKYIGDAIMAVFGAPVSHEDDAERAVRAALAMRDVIAGLNDDLEREHGARLVLHIGINTGEVVAGLLAGDVQHAYTVVGDTVNTAQRFESIAPAGEVVVSDSTRQLTLHRFEFEALAPVMVKNKREPVVPYRVVRERDEELLRDSSPFIGRQAEAETLRTLLAETREGRGRVLNIVGDAGVGKSRLLLEFRRWLDLGVPRVVGRCASFETTTPYALLADLLRATFQIHVSDPETVARARVTTGLAQYGVAASEMTATIILDAMGFGPHAGLDPALQQQILVATARELVARATADLPLVVVVEDLQWIDGASAYVLTELLRDAARLQLLFVATSRPGTTVPWPSQTLTLAPLAERDARDLVEALAGADLTPAVIGQVLERTAGSPFFIEEVVRQLKTGGGEIPATVQEVVEARLDRLLPEPREVIDTAAVIGRSFWLRLLERLLPGRALAASLEALEAAAFVARSAARSEITYLFRQPILQEVAYQVQLVAARRAAHALVGAAIEFLYPRRLDEFTDQLAYHYARSEDREKALTWLVRAGDRARQLFANDEAIALYREALERAQDGYGPRDAGAILEAIGDVQTLVGAYDDAIATYDRARERGATADALVLARLLRKTGTAYRWKAEYRTALATLAHARETLGTGDDRELARIALQEGMARFHHGEYAAARTAFLEGVAIAQRTGADDTLAEGLKSLGNVANNVGDLAEAIERYRTSLAIYERLDDLPGIADVRSNLGNMFRRTGRYDEALAEHRASLAMRERIGHRWGVGTCHNNIGETLRSMGQPAGAIPELERAYATWHAIGATNGAGLARMNLGAARLETGDVTGALRELRAAEPLVEGTKFLPGLHRDLASTLLASGDLDAASRESLTALDLARAMKAKQTEAQVKRVQAQIALARDDQALARALLEESRAIFAELGEGAELARNDAVAASLSAS